MQRDGVCGVDMLLMRHDTTGNKSTIRASIRGKLFRSLVYMGTGYWRACINHRPYSVIGGNRCVTNLW